MEFIRPKRISLSLDMAPLIDIVFQLLIFFMLSLSFFSPVLRLDLPKAAQHDKREPERVVVSVDRAGSVFINAQQVPMGQLRGHLEAKLAQDSKKAVHLRGDQEMPYRLFVQVMDFARQAGARQINIVHESEG